VLNLVTYVVLHSKVENNFLDNHEASYIKFIFMKTNFLVILVQRSIYSIMPCRIKLIYGYCKCNELEYKNS